MATQSPKRPPQKSSNNNLQGRDKAVYVRNQQGHSLTKWILFGWAVLYIPAIYYTFSKNHYWHA